MSQKSYRYQQQEATTATTTNLSAELSNWNRVAQAYQSSRPNKHARRRTAGGNYASSSRGDNRSFDNHGKFMRDIVNANNAVELAISSE